MFPDFFNSADLLNERENQVPTNLDANKLIDQLDEKIGLVPVLLGLIALGIFYFFLAPLSALFISFLIFAITALYQLIYGRLKTRLALRIANPPSYLQDGLISNPSVGMTKVHHETKHAGFNFRILAFENIPMPSVVSDPLCPNCKCNLIESPRILFPFRARVLLRCTCGFSSISKQTKKELRLEVEQLYNLHETENMYRLHLGVPPINNQ